jgi:hypothetical protein
MAVLHTSFQGHTIRGPGMPLPTKAPASQLRPLTTCCLFHLLLIAVPCTSGCQGHPVCGSEVPLPARVAAVPAASLQAVCWGGVTTAAAKAQEAAWQQAGLHQHQTATCVRPVFDCLQQQQQQQLPVSGLYAGEVYPRQLLRRKRPRGNERRDTSIKLPPA